VGAHDRVHHFGDLGQLLGVRVGRQLPSNLVSL
jgi:hypothetical protein